MCRPILKGLHCLPVLGSWNYPFLDAVRDFFDAKIMRETQLRPKLVLSQAYVQSDQEISRWRAKTTAWRTTEAFTEGQGSWKRMCGKGGKSKSKTTRTPMPKELLGHSNVTRSGEPICFDYNLPHGCTRAKAGQRCNKGLHVCCKKSCGKPPPHTRGALWLTTSWQTPQCPLLHRAVQWHGGVNSSTTKGRPEPRGPKPQFWNKICWRKSWGTWFMALCGESADFQKLRSAPFT